MDSRIRKVVPGDATRIAELCESERRRYSAGYANYYAPAADYAEKKRLAVLGLIADDASIALVHESNGELDGVFLGRMVAAPPVYDPGGKVCLFDEFVVDGDAAWSRAGSALIDAVDGRIRDLGGVLLIIECMHAAAAKRDLLSSIGFTIASDWLCRDIDLSEPKHACAGVIERATADDLPAMLNLAAERRLLHESFQPVFWRVAADANEKQAPYLSWRVGHENSIVLVHRTDTGVDGFIVADPFATQPLFDRAGTSCNVDDFTVAGDSLWPVGEWLLYRATVEAKSRGAVNTQVICANADTLKFDTLAHIGYEVGHHWYVRSVE